ncbi:cobalt transporter CbiM [Clostridium estertheticum]|uniref:cobalt transporter CbiM n=1 Tax=Clostridium estertheticum TaxID=238834 RepID=UPI0013E8FCE9|nr:cobalt transporter CbiM [Clostridium estertheticum]MBZ9689284.1 cobalt transporter CbiM [Clostridium estertheticum]
MHIPDNYLSPTTCAVMGAVMVPIWKIAVKKVKNELTKKRIPLMGIGAAFAFMVMMFNIPLPGGTTGHAVGATLIALLLGPWAACISITIALLVQAVIFGDGGILAFGANCFNMAFIAPFIGYYSYNLIKQRIKTDKGNYTAIFISAYLALNAAAMFTAIEFGIQPLLFVDGAGLPIYSPYPLNVSIPAMLIPHLLIVGVLEGIITAGVYGFIKQASPGIIYEGLKIKMKPIYGLIIGMVCLSPLGLLATGTAWGEWAPEEINNVLTKGKTLGFIPKGMQKGFSFKALMPDYSVNGISEIMGYILSAIGGIAIVIIIFKLINSKASHEKREF